MKRIIVVIFSVFVVACSSEEKVTENIDPDKPIEFFVTPEGYEAVAYPKKEDYDSFTRALNENSIPFKYQLTTKGYKYVYWPQSYSKKVGQVQSALFGEEPGNFNQVFSTADEEERFKSILDEMRINYKVITYRGMSIVVWSETDNLEVERLLLEKFGINKQAIRDALRKSS